MVWEQGEEAWENKLAAFRSYQRATGHLAPQQDTVWGESETEGLVPIGAAPGQPPPEGRAGQGTLPYIAPGVTFDGDDIGTWRWQQLKAGVQAQLMPEQRERLAKLGIKAAELPEPAPAATRTTRGSGKGPSKAQAAFERVWRPSGSGSSGRARTGRYRAGRSSRSRPTVRASRYPFDWACGSPTPAPGETGSRRSSWTRFGSSERSGRDRVCWSSRPVASASRSILLTTDGVGRASRE